jgi:hypothetical protein
MALRTSGTAFFDDGFIELVSILYFNEEVKKLQTEANKERRGFTVSFAGFC